MYAESFPSRLKKARTKNGFTQAEVAAETGIPKGTIANYEIGRTQPDIETIGILATYYGVTTDWLFGLAAEKRAIG